MMSMMRCLLVVLPIMMLGACNTVRGFGQDMSAAGRGLSNAANTVMGSEPETATVPPPAAQGSSAPRSLTPPPQPQPPK